MPNMTWGNFQSVLQILLGLNIAFYAFKEIRTAKINRIHSDANWLRYVTEELQERVINQGIDVLRDKAKSLRGEVIAFRNELEIFESPRNERREDYFSNAALIFAILAYILLVLSSYLYGSGLNEWLALLISIVFLIPAGGLFYHNLQIVNLVNEEREKFNKLASTWTDLSSNAAQNSDNTKLVEKPAQREPQVRDNGSPIT
jgi:hypothetical protein